MFLLTNSHFLIELYIEKSTIKEIIMKMRNIALIAGLMIGLSGVSVKTESPREQFSNYCFKKIVNQLVKAETFQEFSEELTYCNKLTLFAQGGATIVVGISGFLTAISLLITLKQIFSEKKEKEWKGTKTTTAVVMTIVFGLITGLGCLGGDVSCLLNNWTSSKFNFVKKCGELGLQELIKRFI